ncbi:hypothetical protein GLYMA_20G100150v4 [Glycine max]|nr:hypothetical protein GLYMA_20G100150v4 [Glycine max]KAH1035419.1 hypothetical protein GYH30_055409 [Glycine max]
MSFTPFMVLAITLIPRGVAWFPSFSKNNSQASSTERFHPYYAIW